MLAMVVTMFPYPIAWLPTCHHSQEAWKHALVAGQGLIKFDDTNEFCSTLQMSRVPCPSLQALQPRKSHAPSFPHSIVAHHKLSTHLELQTSRWCGYPSSWGSCLVAFHSSTHAVGSWKRFHHGFTSFCMFLQGFCHVLWSIWAPPVDPAGMRPVSCGLHQPRTAGQILHSCPKWLKEWTFAYFGCIFSIELL